MSSRLIQRRGFTLVELLVVLLILGILIAIAIPLYANTMDTARETTCEANQRIIRGAVALYHAENGQWPDDSEDGDLSALADFLELPIDCPSDGDYNYSVAEDVITVTCTNH